MMPSDELIGAKARLMRSAELALAISGLGGDESLEFEPRDYAEAISCLAAMPDDLSAVLAELDVLRGMFDESVRNFLSEGQSKEGTNASRKTKRRTKKNAETTPAPEQIDGSNGQDGSDSNASEPVSEEQSVSGSESPQDDDTPANKRPRRRRSSRKRTPRSESGGDKGEGSED